jgi:DNA-binding SARP family transcriptional activator
MGWRVLGPVEVIAGGRTLDIRRPQQRAVLALLLLDADRVVPAARLVAALWGDAPPASARTQVQVCVSRIRATLRGAGLAGALSSRAGGYLLAPGPGELDLARFEALVGRAAGAPPEEASAALRAALALWRGPALTGAAGAYVEPAAAALAERRLLAYEQLADAELALGRAPGLVPTLRALVNADPLRERLVGRLMLALAGSGEQGEALRLFTRTRDRLADELGIEPTAELADIQVRVLRQRVSPPATVPAAAALAGLPQPFAWSYRSLAPAAARLFRLLGLHPGPDVDIAAVASLAGDPPPEVRAPLEALVRAHLVAEHRPGRYTLHDLPRAYAAERCRAEDSAAERDAARRRLLDHYLHAAYAADLLLDPHRPAHPVELPLPQPGVLVVEHGDHRAATAWLTAEHRVLLAAAELAADTGLDGHSRRLAATLTTFHLGMSWALARQGRHDDAREHTERALALFRSAGHDGTGQLRARLT